MRPDQQEFADGVKLAAIAVVSAVVTAGLVISAGQNLLPRGEAAVSVTPILSPVALR